ncbi:hypothetical protein QUB05_31100, partial [Microcoleus sp. F10-C6]|uniref:hypothetical protein n=1 Tax=unclassified Microcoleus TaxID=2642155 RepID=UPI002FD3F27B
LMSYHAMANTSLIITYSDPFLQGTTKYFKLGTLGYGGIACLPWDGRPPNSAGSKRRTAIKDNFSKVWVSFTKQRNMVQNIK